MPSYGQRKDGTWYVRWSEKDPATGRRRQPQRSGFPTKRAAESWWAKKRLELDRRQGRGVQQLSVAELMDIWLAAVRPPAIRETTWIEYERCSRLHIVPHLGDIRVEALTPAQIETWHADLRDKDLGPSTVHRVHGVLNRALRRQLKTQAISYNPAADSWPSAPAAGHRTFLDVDEIVRFLELTDPADTYELLWRLALYTGMRTGELLGLTWKHVDLRRGQLRVAQALVDIAGRTWKLMPPKTERANRTISLPAIIRPEIAAHRHRQIERRLALGDAWHDYDFVFENGYGNPLHRQHIWRKLGAFSERHNFPRITMHALRRSHATWLAALGEHVSVAQHRLGHTSSRLTLDLYTLVSDSMDQRAAELLDRSAAGDDGWGSVRER